MRKLIKIVLILILVFGVHTLAEGSHGSFNANRGFQGHSSLNFARNFHRFGGFYPSHDYDWHDSDYYIPRNSSAYAGYNNYSSVDSPVYYVKPFPFSFFDSLGKMIFGE